MFLLLLALPQLHAQDARTVTEPVFPTTCTMLQAQLAIVNGEPSSETAFDTARIQTALNSTACSGKAVELSASGGNYAFLTKPLTLPSNVILLIDPGVTLFASRNPADYQIGTPGGSQEQCGVSASGQPNGCNPLFLSYKTTGTGVEGYGVIDGRGADTLLNTSGTALANPYSSTCTSYTWYCVTQVAHTAGAYQNNPMLLNPMQTSNFTLYKISLIHAPYFTMRWSGPGTGLTVWGAKLTTSATEINTDGIDPVDGISNITITNSYISVGDDNVAITANYTGEPVSAVTISNDYFYAGDGLSIGTGLEGGVSNVVATNIYEDQEANTGESGIHLKGNTSIGGPVSNITYNGFCMQNEPYAILINPLDTPGNGKLIPTFSNLQFENIHVLTSPNGKTSKAQIWGYNASNITSLNFNNVIFDSAPMQDPYPQYANVTYGPGPVSSWITALGGSGSTDVTVTGSVTNPTQAPFPCSAASFPSLIGELFLSNTTVTNQKSLSMVYSSTSSFVVNAVLEPPTAESAALTSHVSFYDSLVGASAVGSVTLGAGGANNTYAPYTVTGASVGTHVYSAGYQDTNYANFTWGSLTVTVAAASTSTAVTLSSSNIAIGSTPTLTATVTSAGGTPSGSVTFYSNGASIGTGTLSGGIATLSTYTFSTTGTFSITAGYAAQGNYGASTSTAQSLNVVSAITVSASATTPSPINPGSTATSTITIAPAGGFIGSVSLTCTSPVAWITCSVTAPAPITGTAPTTSTATITVASSVSSVDLPSHKTSWLAFVFPCAALLLLPLMYRRKVLLRTIAVMVLAALSFSLTACGSGSGTSNTQTPTVNAPPAGNQTLTVTATANGIQAPYLLTVTIN